MVTDHSESTSSSAGKPIAATVSDRLSSLRESESLLADRLRADDGKLTASLAKERRETLREIAELEGATVRGGVLDDLAARRNSRIPGTEGKPAADGTGK